MTDCEPQIYDYFSYGLNILLLIATIYSEVSGLSKCKHNGLIDGLVKSINDGLEDKTLKISKSGRIKRNSEIDV